MNKEEFRAFLKAVPKAELHLHIEAVISMKTILSFYMRRHPSATEAEAKAEIDRIFTYSNLDGFIQAYLAVQDLYDAPDDFDYVFTDLKEYIVRNGISYAEVFAAPSAFIKKGWNFSDLVAVYHRNIVKIEAETGVKVRMLIDVSRTFGFENAEKNLQLLLACRIPEIIGIGLGGSEQKGPARLFGDVFEKARANGLVAVAHAGEDDGPQSVWDTLDILHAARIGHGISSFEDEKLMKTLAERRIPLEICPMSNVFTKKYVQNLAEHPMRLFFDKGIIVTVNSDDPLFFGVELLDEYWNSYSGIGFNMEEIRLLVKNSFTSSFLPEEEKNRFLAAVDKAWGQ